MWFLDFSLQPRVIKNWWIGNSLVVQWLRLRASSAGGVGSIPGCDLISYMLLSWKEKRIDELIHASLHVTSLWIRIPFYWFVISFAFKKGSPVFFCFFVLFCFFLVYRGYNIQTQLTLVSNIIYTPGSAIWCFFLHLILPWLYETFPGGSDGRGSPANDGDMS